eukprot:4904514-Amphidinium_carterae.1
MSQEIVLMRLLPSERVEDLCGCISKVVGKSRSGNAPQRAAAAGNRSSRYESRMAQREHDEEGVQPQVLVQDDHRT